jgi:quercetin dioxygenase-like cupin family protein
MERLVGHQPKGWGSEFIWASNDKYCGKFLHFKKNAKFSMHFHAEKDETWYVLNGQFQVVWIDTLDATEKNQILNPGDIWHNEPLKPHRLICIEEGTVIEVSTADSVKDNHRILPGDSQQK